MAGQQYQQAQIANAMGAQQYQEYLKNQGNRDQLNTNAVALSNAGVTNAQLGNTNASLLNNAQATKNALAGVDLEDATDELANKWAQPGDRPDIEGTLRWQQAHQAVQQAAAGIQNTAAQTQEAMSRAALLNWQASPDNPQNKMALAQVQASHIKNISDIIDQNPAMLYATLTPDGMNTAVDLATTMAPGLTRQQAQTLFQGKLAQVQSQQQMAMNMKALETKADPETQYINSLNQSIQAGNGGQALAAARQLAYERLNKGSLAPFNDDVEQGATGILHSFGVNAVPRGGGKWQLLDVNTGQPVTPGTRRPMMGAGIQPVSGASGATPGMPQQTAPSPTPAPQQPAQQATQQQPAGMLPQAVSNSGNMVQAMQNAPVGTTTTVQMNGAPVRLQKTANGWVRVGQ
jgi:hypothetical protein